MYLVFQCLCNSVISGVVEVDLASLHSHRAPRGYLRRKLDSVVHQLFPARELKGKCSGSIINHARSDHHGHVTGIIAQQHLLLMHYTAHTACIGVWCVK